MVSSDEETWSGKQKRDRLAKPRLPGRGVACQAGLVEGAEGAGVGRGNGLHGFDGACDKCRLHLADGIVDGDTLTFVEDFYAEDLGRAHGTVFVGAGEGDVERQDLIRVPRGSQFLGPIALVRFDMSTYSFWL